MADDAATDPAADMQETPADSETVEDAKEEWGEDISPEKDGKLYKKMLEVRAVARFEHAEMQTATHRVCCRREVETRSQETGTRCLFTTRGGCWTGLFSIPASNVTSCSSSRWERARLVSLELSSPQAAKVVSLLVSPR